MARKNVTKVFESFLKSESARGPKGSVSTNGRVIYSYAMPIAVRTTAGVVVSKESPTVTTTIHRNNVRTLLRLNGQEYTEATAREVKALADAA